MLSNELLLDALKGFAGTLVHRYEVTEVLYELSDRAAEVLGADGAGVSLADDRDQIQFVSATNQAAVTLEAAQQAGQEGPCFEAYRTNRPVLVDDLHRDDRWPVYRATAQHVGYRAVLGIPMTGELGPLGALNVYQAAARSWTEDDVAAAVVLADMATGFVRHASELDQARRLNEQLQSALESRVLIEQAKGILAGERRISMTQAFEVLRQHARNNNATLRSVATAVVELGLRP